MAESGYCYRCIGGGTHQFSEAKDRHVVSCGYSAAEFNTSSVEIPDDREPKFAPSRGEQNEQRYFNRMRTIYNT